MICSPREKNIAGQRFGKLVAVRRDFSKTNKAHTYWLFDCDCGDTVAVRKNSVMTGAQTTCGCSRDEADISGQRFNKWVAIERDISKQGKDPYWFFRCDCGSIESVRKYTVVNNISKACGCMRAENGRNLLTTHGMWGHELYEMWHGMKKRCHDERDRAYKLYGARGIKVCDRWRYNFDLFVADMGERPQGMSIDRIDNNKGYEPSNCRWATIKQQANNRRDNISVVIDGVSYSTIAEAHRQTGLSISIINREYR